MLKNKEKFGNSMLRNKKLDQEIILKLNFLRDSNPGFSNNPPHHKNQSTSDP